MCGILGGISTEPFAFLEDERRLSAAIDTLAHRGPDDRGQFVAPDRRSFLGHRRLSIIDLAGGREPISDESGRRRLCYNGEVYNYRRLRDELLSRGHAFRTQVDGEVALHLYEEGRDEFVAHLQGMFAIAILDEEDGALTLARDRNGIKPLYYYLGDKSLIFASELKAILPLLPRRADISSYALRQYLRWKYIPAPLTIYENIHKLPPGCMLRAAADSGSRIIESSVRRYWEPDYSDETLSDEREAVDALDRKLREVVDSHLQADVEVGALLSGGVDSSLVVAMAATLSDRRVKTFSVGFEETGFDQLPFARTLAQKYGTEHFEEHVRLDPMTTVPILVSQFDEPFADSSALACFRVCQVASEHVKVVLTGDGGDESFAGYGRYEEVLDGPARLSPWRRFLNRSIEISSSALFSPEAKYLKRIRGALHKPLERHEQHQVMCSPWLTNRLLAPTFRADTVERDIFDEHRQVGMARGWQPVNIAQFIDLRMYLPGDILTKVDRTSMACSLECRVPLLDHSITQFSAGLAPHLKLRNGVRKYLLKKVAERYVPHELLYRPKMGFRIPVRRWFKRGLLKQTADLMREGALVECGILDRAGLQWVFRQQRRPWIDFGSHLWALLFLEHWCRLYYR